MAQNGYRLWSSHGLAWKVQLHLPNALLGAGLDQADKKCDPWPCHTNLPHFERPKTT